MNAKHSHYKFESMADLIAAKELPIACEGNKNHSYINDSSFAQEPRWICADRHLRGHTDIKKALAAQTFGAGVARVEALANKLSAPAPRNRRRRPVRSDAGDELDMGRVWAGDLEHAWRTTHREQSVGPSRILIIIDMAAHAGIGAEVLACRGAATLALASVLRENGYTVSAIAGTNQPLIQAGGMFGTKSDYRYSSEVTLLSPEHELDLHKLANLCASGLLFRGVIIDHIVRTSPVPLSPGISVCPPLVMSDFDTNGFDHVAVINAGVADDQASAQAWLQKQIAALG